MDGCHLRYSLRWFLPPVSQFSQVLPAPRVATSSAGRHESFAGGRPARKSNRVTKRRSIRVQRRSNRATKRRSLQLSTRRRRGGLSQATASQDEEEIGLAQAALRHRGSRQGAGTAAHPIACCFCEPDHSVHCVRRHAELRAAAAPAGCDHRGSQPRCSRSRQRRASRA